MCRHGRRASRGIISRIAPDAGAKMRNLSFLSCSLHSLRASNRRYSSSPAEAFIEEISPDVDLGLRPKSNSFRTNVCSKRGFFPQFNPLHFSRVLINAQRARLTHRIPSNHGFKIVGPQIFIPHIPVPLNPGRLFTAPVVHRTTHALFAHRPLRVLFLFQRLSL